MEKDTISEIVNDLKAKRDCLSLFHECLKQESDKWNKTIIVMSLLNGMIESTKLQLGLTTDLFKLMPIFLSSIIAIISSLIKFKEFPQKMEVIIQSQSLLTNCLNKARNKTNCDAEILEDYHKALEYLEVSIYPDLRKKFLKQSHKNLIEIMKMENKYYTAVDAVNEGQTPDTSSDDTPLTSPHYPPQHEEEQKSEVEDPVSPRHAEV